MIGLVVTFRLRPGHEAEFDVLLGDVLNGIRVHEPGTLMYARAKEANAPGSRVLLEVYRDEAAFRAHEEQPHTRAFLEARANHGAAPIEVRGLRVDHVAGAWAPSGSRRGAVRAADRRRPPAAGTRGVSF